MVVANPFNKLDYLLGDNNDPKQLPSGTQEEELGSNPSAGAGTRPTESTNNFTRGGSNAGEGTRPTESTANFTRARSIDGEGTRPTESTDNFTTKKNRILLTNPFK